MPTDLRPFKISIPDSVLDDLRERLARTRWPDEIPSSEWDYGTPLSYIKELCEYWRTEFDWRKAEAMLNGFDQFMADVEGQPLHFIHHRSKHDGAMPLVITHGWPGSIFEFHKIIGPLTDPTAHGGRAEDAFHVVCPSIPGYGFSPPSTEPGMDVCRVAELVAALMAQLGYDRYGAQGGDWGSAVTTWLGDIAKDHVTGIHLNMVAAPARAGDTEGISPEELRYMAERRAFMKHEVGYRQIQSTKPQTLGYGLNDSPAGLAAWIVEKFRTWSDCGGDVESVFTKDELLTNITIYWVTGTIASSTRLYYESRKSKRFGPKGVSVPTGCAVFPEELFNPARKWAEAYYNVRQWTVMERGGHFAALEQPEALVGDIRSFFSKVR